MPEEKMEEETYSLIFKSLKHPIRRKILRILRGKQLTFSQILDVVSIDSGHLSYHIENLSELIKHSSDGKYGLSSVGMAAVDLMSGVEEHPQYAREKTPHLLSQITAVIVTPIMLGIFVWCLETAKDHPFFVELMFLGFIPLVVATVLLVISRIQEAPKLLRTVLCVVTVLFLVSTIMVAYSLAMVPRGGEKTSIDVAPGTFAGNITRQSNGEYIGRAYTTFFTQNHTVSEVYTWGPNIEDVHGIGLQTDVPNNLSGTLWFYSNLHRRTEDYRHEWPLFYTFHETSIEFAGSTHWTGTLPTPKTRWGDDNEYERMRLDGYHLEVALYLELNGTDHGDVIPFTATINDAFYIHDFSVDSTLQNGMAIVLCGIFSGISLYVLALPIAQTVHTLTAKKDE